MTSLVLEQRDLNFIFYTLGTNCIPSEDREAVLRLYLDQLSLPVRDRDHYIPPQDPAHADSRRTGEEGTVGQPGFLPARTQNSILNSRFARCLVRRDDQDADHRHLGVSLTSCINEVNSVLLQEFQTEEHHSTVAFPVLPDQICIDRQRNPNPNDPYYDPNSLPRPFPTRANPCSLILTENPPHDPNNPNEDRGSHSTRIDQITYAELPYPIPAELNVNELQVCRRLQDEAEHAGNFDSPYQSAFEQTSTQAIQIRRSNAELYRDRTETSLAAFSNNFSQGYFLRNYRDFIVQRIQDGTRTLQEGDQTPPMRIGDATPRNTITAEESEAQARVRARPGDPHFGSRLRFVWNWAATPAAFLFPPHQRMNLFELGVASNWDRYNIGASLVYGANFSMDEHNLLLSATPFQYRLSDFPNSFWGQFHFRLSAMMGVNLNRFNTAEVLQGQHLIGGGMIDFTTYNNIGCLLPSFLLILPAPQEMDHCLREPHRALNIPTSSTSFGVAVLFQSEGDPIFIANLSFRNFHDAGWAVDAAFLLSGLIYSLTQTR